MCLLGNGQRTAQQWLRSVVVALVLQQQREMVEPGAGV